jgi:hypothetical protein
VTKKQFLLLAVVIALLLSACTQAAIVYEVIDLGTLGGRANCGSTHFWVSNISVTGNLPCAEIDLSDDCQLNFQDLAVFAEAWLDCNRDPDSEC